MLPTELMRLAAHPKVKTNHLQKSRVIRLVICIDCQKHYIGETATPSTPYNRLKLVRIYWALFVGQLCHKWTSIHLCCFLSVLACIKVKLITLIYPSSLQFSPSPLKFLAKKWGNFINSQKTNPVSVG